MLQLINKHDKNHYIIKLFNEYFILNVKMIKAVHGPIPQAKMMPTGGVSLDNVADWLKAGCIAIGTGGALTAPAKKGDYAGVTKNAEAFVKAVAAARA
jgi:2-dehydro-3-deoxyphosphogluconate aldolase/(4S)-4-hydroxy-2-oxoglutarate aldolase